ALGVSSGSPTTVAVRHVTLPSTAVPAMGHHRCGSRGSPKSLVCRGTSASCPSPISALPQVEMGNEKPRRAAVFGLKIGTVVFERNPGLLVHNIFEGQVRGVVAIRAEHRVRQVCLYVCKQNIERNTFPGCAEFRPSRYTVQIDRDIFGGQLTKRLPIPSLQNVAAVIDGKFPAIKGYVWCRPRRQHGKIRSEVLTRREFGICCTASTGKTSRDDSHKNSYSATRVV